MEIDELFKELNENIVAEAVSNLLPPSSIPSQAQETPLHSASTTARHISKSDGEEEQAKESSHQFAPPKSDKEVEQARDSGKPTKTKQDTKYCVGLWEAWVEHRAQVNGDSISCITQLSRKELQYWMTRFIL